VPAPRAPRLGAALAPRAPSGSALAFRAVFCYLAAFHDAEEEAKRVAGKAFIPAPTEALKALYRVNQELVAFKQAKTPQQTATLDMDATLIETYKRLALFCYQGYAAYQPLTLYWHEQRVVVHSESRDGNVPAGFDPVRVLKASLQALPRASSRCACAPIQWAMTTSCSSFAPKATRAAGSSNLPLGWMSPRRSRRRWLR
jgi:hypothetical protein